MIALRLCAIACALIPILLQAAPRLAPDAVPAPLKAWIPWVLDAHRDLNCPFAYNSVERRRCAWPGLLELNLSAQGGEFIARWQVFADTWVALPGDFERWPQDVMLDGSAVAVVARGPGPAVKLAPGQHQLRGNFSWLRLPESLALPAESGLVRLAIDGRSITDPKVDAHGYIWLRAPEQRGAATSEQKQNALTLTVLRRIVDDNPLELDTRIELDVTGDPREAMLGKPLPDNYIPVGISSQLPTRLEANGNLAVQLRAGHHVISVHARHPTAVTEITLPLQSSNWPAHETWVFDPRHHLRIVEIEGLPSLDPRQTQLPPEWHHLQAFSYQAGETMRLIETRRGDPDPEPDELNLVRKLWLDFDGHGYTTQDEISGQITRNWRLNSSPNLALGQVKIDGVPQFITRTAEDSEEGIEVRRGGVDLQADGRMLGSIQDFAATGWAHDFHAVQATLQLPPAWDVFAIRGVDNNPDTWLSRWTLLDLFLVLVIAAVAARLWDWRTAALALSTTILIWHAAGAPRYAWVHLLLAIALLRVLPRGRVHMLVTTYRNVTAIALIFICIPFVMQQLRAASYPQLMAPPYAVQQSPQLTDDNAVADAMPLAMSDGTYAEAGIAYDEARLAGPSNIAAAPVAKMMRSALPRAQSAQSMHAPGEALYALDPDAIVQTGPGLPSWRSREIHLNWNGPVSQNQRLSIHYMSPAVNRVLNVARVVTLLALLLVVFGVRFGQLRRWPRVPAVSALLVLALAVVAFSPGADAALIPDEATLAELERRLTAPPECAENCADIPRMHVDIATNTLTIRLQVHTTATTSIPLPGNAATWLPEDVLVDEVVSSALARDNAGTLWQELSSGIHHIILRGRLPEQASVQIAMPLRARLTKVEHTQDWQVAGVRDNGLVEAQIQLTRVRKGSEAATRAEFEATQLAPFVRVERTLELGLDWTVTTRVVRQGPSDAAVVLSVPLLAGEAVITPNVAVADGAVQVNLARSRNEMSWQSVLKHAEAITLQAPATTSWSETWRLLAGPVWHISLSGIAPIHHRGDGDRWLPEWRPWPGEVVNIAVTRPQGVSGQTVTLDSSILLVTPGKRATELTLDVSLRSSKGGQHVIGLPANAQLQQVRINGVQQPIRVNDQRLTLPISPGSQQLTITWRTDEGISSLFRTPPIDLGSASVNHEIKIRLGQDRWTLFALGPRLGPAVLFWSLLGALLITAFALSRTPYTPLETREWLLLVVGLSQLFLPLAAVVVAWLIALGLRQCYGGKVSYLRFNLMQLGLALLTIGALMVLVEAIRMGLLGHPNMHVAGNGSSAHALDWYADRVAAEPPTAAVISVPILVYRLLMLAWALWLALAIVRWLRWGWECFATDGLWQSWRRPQVDSAQPSVPTAT